MKQSVRNFSAIIFTGLAATIFWPAGADVDLGTGFSNTGGISNTRHNLTQITSSSLNPNNNDPLSVSNAMGQYRNNYNQVCVYCHTPHGANTSIDAPLWNRSHLGNNYQTYDTLGTSTITSDFVQPGINSLTCLSCHDGTLPVDSIINMPGSGGYNVAQQGTATKSFLDSWTNTIGQDASSHMSLDGEAVVVPIPNSPDLHIYPGSNNVLGAQDGGSCLSCHAPGTQNGAGATDFRMFAIGTDLRNDHPVGVRLPPNGNGTDFKTPAGSKPGMLWFDLVADGRPSSDEIRFYDTGNGPRVECASCHDPHGVSPTGFSGKINPSFLRVSNENSAVCLTCHVK